MAARCIPTTTGPIARLVTRARAASLRMRLLCARQALSTCRAYDDRDGYADFWAAHIEHLRAELRAIESD